jgi:hypothetical protein
VKILANLSGLFELGHAIGPVASLLRNFNQNPQLSPLQLMWLTGLLRASLNEVVSDKILPFQQTKESAIQLIGVVDEIWKSRSDTGTLAVPFRPDELLRLESAITDLTVSLRREVDGMPIFFVTPRRAYDVKALLNDAAQVLNQSHVGLLAPGTLDDVREAGICIAFAVPTAAGFHSVRAVEAVARGYHEIVVGGPRPGAETPLGPLINGLRTKRDVLLSAGRIDKQDLLSLVIDFLTRINNIYRKPLTHPEMTLDPEGAMTVFDSVKCSIDLVLEDAPRKSAAKIPAGFF